MSRLIYSAILSLDGYISDASGSFDWAVPDEEVHTYINDRERPVGTYLYGRRMYETMVYWESPPTGPETSDIERDYAAVWQSAEKIVYSRTLDAVASVRTHLERHFDTEAVRELKESSPRDLGIGGPELAGQALAAGLVDEIHLYVVPVLVGGGRRALPDSVRLDLQLVDEHRFGNGMVHLRYQLS